METSDLKHCPICERDLPLSKFGRCRARKDGKNLYCMECVNERTQKHRKSLKPYKEYQKQLKARQLRFLPSDSESAEPTPIPVKLSPVERVRDAIQRGFSTQKEIHLETGLWEDEIGDAIANLLLWSKEIRTEVIDDLRMYFLIEVEQLERKPNVVSPSLWTVASQVGPVVKGERRVRAVA